MDEITTYNKWEEVPDGLATKTTLSRDLGLKVAAGQEPVARKKQYDRKGRHVGYYDLYAVADAAPKKVATSAQLAALEKARYMAEQHTVSCSRCGQPEETRYGYVTVTRKQWIENDYAHFVCRICCDHDEASQWAADLLTSGKFVILDTETTDLNGEIIEIAVIDPAGTTLLNQRVKPLGKIAPGAQAVHGISLEALKDAPTWPEVYPKLKATLEGKLVIIYNRAFDNARISGDCHRHNLKMIKYESECAMVWYSQWCGVWSNYHDDYRWQPLGGGHDALGDCLATLERLKEMAGSENEGEDEDASGSV